MVYECTPGVGGGVPEAISRQTPPRSALFIFKHRSQEPAKTKGPKSPPEAKTPIFGSEGGSEKVPFVENATIGVGANPTLATF